MGWWAHGHHIPQATCKREMRLWPQWPPQSRTLQTWLGLPAHSVHRGSLRGHFRAACAAFQDSGLCSFPPAPGGEGGNCGITACVRPASPTMCSLLANWVTGTETGVYPPEAPSSCLCLPTWCAKGREAPEPLPVEFPVHPAEAASRPAGPRCQGARNPHQAPRAKSGCMTSPEELRHQQREGSEAHTGHRPRTAVRMAHLSSGTKGS